MNEYIKPLLQTNRQRTHKKDKGNESEHHFSYMYNVAINFISSVESNKMLDINKRLQRISTFTGLQCHQILLTIPSIKFLLRSCDYLNPAVFIDSFLSMRTKIYFLRFITFKSCFKLYLTKNIH